MNSHPPGEDQGYWEHYDHGADIGIRGTGASKISAFEQAALALTAVVTDPAGVAPKTRVVVECDVGDVELLFVEWLNAIIYEMATRNMVFCRFEVAFHDGGLTGTLWGEPVDIGRHRPAVEIKGATLTTLTVNRGPEGRWTAQTVVDV